MHDVTGKDLAGRAVVDREGSVLGRVQDIHVDPESWRVRGIVVDIDRKVARSLGLHTPLMGGSEIELRPERVQAVGDAVILNLGSRDIADALRQR